VVKIDVSRKTHGNGALLPQHTHTHTQIHKHTHAHTNRIHVHLLFVQKQQSLCLGFFVDFGRVAQVSVSRKSPRAAPPMMRKPKVSPKSGTLHVCSHPCPDRVADGPPFPPVRDVCTLAAATTGRAADTTACSAQANRSGARPRASICSSHTPLTLSPPTLLSLQPTVLALTSLLLFSHIPPTLSVYTLTPPTLSPHSLSSRCLARARAL
jgi:hypothetical protein